MRVSKPPRAATIAIPAPIVPAPATATVLMLCVISGICAFIEETASDQLPVHLIGPFPYLGDLRIAHEAFDSVISAVTDAAVQLHRLGRHAHSEVGSTHLQDRGFDTEIRRTVIDRPADAPQKGITKRILGGEIRNQELYSLELQNPFAGLLAGIYIVDGVVECRPRDAQCVRRDARSRFIEGRE